MSIVKDARQNENEDKTWVNESSTAQNIETYELEVETRTLTSILEQYKVKEIDFFSLDVEGFELQVLQGLDFNKFAPKFILVEANFKQDVCNYLFLQNYKVVQEFGGDNILFKKI